ncbi:uncharacterized protein LOC119100212 [Pollicipes pollicipes]|uniref:uncharacterized protein LOC119100212 n=1 Tax=Pollicipes pollicipes TaxID=41117 RepID=UPI0018854B42|nr:uncharacterized protein LOC119100212 [Pollicipes pollicipes]
MDKVGVFQRAIRGYDPVFAYEQSGGYGHDSACGDNGSMRDGWRVEDGTTRRVRELRPPAVSGGPGPALTVSARAPLAGERAPYNKEEYEGKNVIVCSQKKAICIMCLVFVSILAIALIASFARPACLPGAGVIGPHDSSAARGHTANHPEIFKRT